MLFNFLNNTINGLRNLDARFSDLSYIINGEGVLYWTF